MPLHFNRATVHFEADCTVDETIALVEFLRSHKAAKVHMNRCTYAHTFLIRALIAYRPQILSLPQDALLSKWLFPIAGQRQTATS